MSQAKLNESLVKLNLWQRNDDFVDVPKSFTKDDQIRKVYVLKEYLSKVGSTEDDFIVDLKPVLVDEYNVQEQITEQAKGTDLKSLIAQVLRTGDSSILEQRHGSYADLTNMPKDCMSAQNEILKGKDALSSLPDDLKKGKDISSIASMSETDIKAYIDSVIAKQSGLNEPVVSENKESEVKTDVK